MSLPHKDLYAASCNPPRRAKRPRAEANPPNSTSPRNADDTPTSPAVAIQPRPILPKRAASSGRPGSGHMPSSAGYAAASVAMASATSSEASSTPPMPPTSHPLNKRGRKPGPLSRSAREAQRRLNHSIIEKARRTKINNALATLKQLVPPDYGRNPKTLDDNDSDDGEDGDDDDVDYTREKKSKPKASGKKEEKEREYKLEILVRTVAFMQDLLQRVAVLEQATHTCSACGAGIETEQAKAEAETRYRQASSSDTSGDSYREMVHRAKRPRTTNYNRKPVEVPSLPCASSQGPAQESILPRHRLPSISSWLPETLLDPSLFNVSPSARLEHLRNKEVVAPLQLPTPPSSSLFNPLHPAATTTTTAPTTLLTFSKTNNPQKTLSPTRTPEDESAASMLLQIRGIGSSPVFRPLPPSVLCLGSTSTITPPLPPSVANGGPDAAHAPIRARRTEGLAVQTPASLLGLVTVPST